MINLLKYYYAGTNIKALLIFLVVQAFIFYGIYLDSDNGFHTFSQYFFQLHQGPASNKDFLNGLSWYFPLVFCIYLVGESVNDDLSKRSELIFLRVPKLLWFLSRVLYILTFAFLVIATKFLLAMVIYALFTHSHVSALSFELSLFYYTLPVLVLSLFNVFSIYLISFMAFGNKLTYMVICTALLLPWLLTFNKMTMFIPGSFSMLGHHTHIHNSMGLFSYGLDIVIILFTILLAGGVYIHQKDII